MNVVSTTRSSGVLRPQSAGGAASFYEHTPPNFLDAGYAAAPPRIRAALEEEIVFLRRVLSGSGRVLEMGCGSGRLLEALHDCARSWVGVDFMVSFLRRARQRADRLASLAAGSIAGLPFADSSFDAAVCAQSTLGLLGDRKQAALREAVRVLRPCGRLVVVVYSEYSVVPRIEWYREMNRRQLMAPIDWARSGPELLITEDGHASECFRRERLEQLFRSTGLAPHLHPVGELYWAVEAEKS